MDHMIEAEGLTKNFGDTQALAGVSLAARPGMVLGVLGPNGAGKTTSIRILSTLLRPDGGTARIAGHDVVKDPHAVRQTIGLTGQYASVDQDLTGMQNLELIGRLVNFSRRDARARAAELLDWFDLADVGHKVTKTYSGGMRRRLDLAASLVARPAVIFLDEPTTGLDPAKREEMWDVVRTLVADGSTVLLTTQNLEEADALADEITVFDKGTVIAHDTPEGLKHVVGGQRVRVSPRDPARLGDVHRIVAEVATGEATREGRNQVTAPVADESALAFTLDHLSRAGIGVLEASVHLPSLDEVFLTLTGRQPGEATDDADSHEENAA
jgi:oleandomycin transport system ATP-binding protein